MEMKNIIMFFETPCVLFSVLSHSNWSVIPLKEKREMSPNLS